MDCEIHMRMYAVYGTECYYKINSELTCTEIQGGTNEHKQSLEKVDHWKEGPVVVCHNKLIDPYEKCLTTYGDYVKKIGYNLENKVFWSLGIAIMSKNRL